MSEKTSSLKLIPVMLAFFAMGFVDLVGIASNYLKADLGLSDSEANIFPSLVFFWFLIFSVPTGMLMNRIGRKKTVLLSLIVTFLSLMIPIFDDAYMVMLISFSLLGIGNALMQTSLNPLLSNIVSGDKLASSLTFGQFVKAIASFLAPYIAMWGATQAIPSMGLGWRVLFPVYMVIAVIAILLLGATTIHETKEEGRPSTFGECLALLGKPFILLCFIGIMCHVGIDVGTNTTAPKMQTSLNPLLSNIVSGDKLASSLTFGQFVKAIASFLAPYIAMWGATQAIPSMGLGWRVLFPVYMVIAVIAILLLGATTIHETKEEGRPSTFGECLALLGKPFILLCFIGIMCHVGIDVGTNTTAPKILMERLGMTLADAGFATSLYFIFRTAGCFSGAFILRKVSPKGFFAFSVFLMLLAMIGLLFFHSKEIIYACIALIGFGNSNVFSIIFAQALLSMPNKQNEVSGLMIMGLFGGTIFPIFMGVASDMLASQVGAVLVLCVGVAYLLFFTSKLSKQ